MKFNQLENLLRLKALFTYLLYGTVQIVDYYFGLSLPALT